MTSVMTAVKTRQQAMWASGDFAVIGTTIQILGEMICEAVDLRGGERVLDERCRFPTPASTSCCPPSA